ncbi:DUF488 family protein [Bacteroides heparinolyticus]|uniref:DUF488 family protein n=1 Tax=Prevotella heparinolytica TaxID=28113 RepID=UPI003F9F1C1F
MIKIYTIGVYNSTEDSYFNKLKSNNIDLFCDIRQRRGVRGAQYKYVNSNYLQSKLSDMGIKYLYIKELAPTTEIRQKQKDADNLNRETKKQRVTLGEVFASEYCNQILNKFDIGDLIEQIKSIGARNVVFFCVEEHAEACHRSLVANKIGKLLDSEIKNL